MNFAGLPCFFRSAATRSTAAISMPSAVLRNADERRLQVVKCGNRAAVSRQLDDHRIARIDQHAPHEIEALLRSARDDDVFESRADAARLECVREQMLDERAVAARRAVLQRVAVVAREDLRRDRLEVVPRETRPARDSRQRARSSREPIR
jgi:hypothetical protein